MATEQAIATTGEAILGLLAEARPRPEFDGARFELYQAGSFQEPMEDGVSLYLYRVAINGNRRNLPPRLGPDGRRYRPSLPLDLFYLLTPWARTAERQQRMLGWCMRALEDTPTLPASLLNHYGPDAGTFQPDETITLVADPISMQDMNAIWDPFKPRISLSVAYVAHLVAIESRLDLDEYPPVQTRVFQAGTVRTP